MIHRSVDGCVYLQKLATVREGRDGKGYKIGLDKLFIMDLWSKLLTRKDEWYHSLESFQVDQ